MDVSGRHVSSQVLPGARGARLTAELPAYAAATPDPAPVQPYPGRAQPTPWGPGLRALPSSPNEVTKRKSRSVDFTLRAKTASLLGESL